jgi:Protein of unknown function (DUF3304)
MKTAISQRWMESLRPMRYVLALMCVAVSSACNSQSPSAATAAAASATTPVADTNVQAHNLTIYGYNYTDTGIGSFEVNGQGGGNLEVSVPTAGGGKSACCVTLYSPMLEARVVKIKWSRDLDTWCEQEVILNPPLPPKPKYFEVHFYRDGHVEVAATETDSPPRLALATATESSRNRDPRLNVNNDTKFARCKRGYR